MLPLCDGNSRFDQVEYREYTKIHRVYNNPICCDVTVIPVQPFLALPWDSTEARRSARARAHWRCGIDTNCLIPVSDTPSFAITRLPGFGIPIVEGMSVSLKCEVDSNPASAPIWQRGKWQVRKKREKKKDRTYNLMFCLTRLSSDLMQG